MSNLKISKTNPKVPNGKVRGTPVLTTAMSVIYDIKKTVEESETIVSNTNTIGRTDALFLRDEMDNFDNNGDEPFNLNIVRNSQWEKRKLK